MKFGHSKIFVVNPTNYSLGADRKREVNSISTSLVTVTLNEQNKCLINLDTCIPITSCFK